MITMFSFMVVVSILVFTLFRRHMTIFIFNMNTKSTSLIPDKIGPSAFLSNREFSIPSCKIGQHAFLIRSFVGNNPSLKALLGPYAFMIEA